MTQTEKPKPKQIRIKAYSLGQAPGAKKCPERENEATRRRMET
jgi:hypothetical protein